VQGFYPRYGEVKVKPFDDEKLCSYMKKKENGASYRQIIPTLEELLHRSPVRTLTGHILSTIRSVDLKYFNKRTRDIDSIVINYDIEKTGILTDIFF